MAKKNKFWTTDKLVALTAMSVSLLTLYIFVRQTNIIETQSHLSVMPYLMTETSNNGEKGEFSIDLSNYGVGPAIIESRIFYYKGKSYDMELSDFLEQNIPEMDSVIAINYTSIQPGIAIPADGSRNMITVGGTRESYMVFLRIFEKLRSEDFDYEIKYKSIYKDHWKITSKDDIPVKIE